MDDLIRRLEAQAEAPRSRELDTRIKIALDDPLIMVNGGNHKGYGVEWAPASAVFMGGWKDWEAAAMQCGALPYTTSLDAALTDEDIIKTERDADGWHATARGLDGKTYYGFAATEPIARRIAALRARATLQQERGAERQEHLEHPGEV